MKMMFCQKVKKVMYGKGEHQKSLEIVKFCAISEYEDYISHPINAFGVIKRMSAEEIINFDDDELEVKRELLKNITQR